MNSGIIVYRENDGDYSKTAFYSSKVEGVFGLMEATGTHIINKRISRSSEEIRTIDTFLEDILKKVNNTSVSCSKKEESINFAFQKY